MDTSTPPAEACAMQLVEALALVPVAVTRTLSLVPISAPLGMATVRVAVPEAPAASGSDVGEIVRLQLALSAVVKEYVSETPPSLLTVTV
jgi:hypothetical protein